VTCRQIDAQGENEVASPCHQEDEPYVENTSICQDPAGHDDHVRWNGREEILHRCPDAHEKVHDLDRNISDEVKERLELLLHGAALPARANRGMQRVDIADLI
jgi:hypothetical protein